MLFHLAVIALALAAHWKGMMITMPLPPWNRVLIVTGTLCAMILGAVFSRQAWVRWLSGASFAVSIICIGADERAYVFRYGCRERGRT